MEVVTAYFQAQLTSKINLEGFAQGTKTCFDNLQLS
jgi:hypothetical protein